MRSIHELPVPDLDLNCPACHSPLAGLAEHRCSCGKPFDMVRLLARHRPIPDLGLTCPECEYPLTGLIDCRCPECGSEFDLVELLEEEAPRDDRVPDGAEGWPEVAPIGAPLFTGQEQPLPDFGLHCAACEQPLAGADNDICRHCGERFDLSLAPGRNWLNVEAFVPRHLAETCCSILHAAGIPYVRGRDMPLFAKPTQRRIPSAHILVHRDFYFDALYCIAEAARPASQVASDPWTCSSCDEHVPGGFEICWSCGQAHPGLDENCEHEDGND
jgi:hypothetical protein